MKTVLSCCNSCILCLQAGPCTGALHQVHICCAAWCGVILCCRVHSCHHPADLLHSQAGRQDTCTESTDHCSWHSRSGEHAVAVVLQCACPFSPKNACHLKALKLTLECIVLLAVCRVQHTIWHDSCGCRPLLTAQARPGYSAWKCNLRPGSNSGNSTTCGCHHGHVNAAPQQAHAPVGAQWSAVKCMAFLLISRLYSCSVNDAAGQPIDRSRLKHLKSRRSMQASRAGNTGMCVEDL